jgi:transcriptional regulator with XRE-family HTH domain
MNDVRGRVNPPRNDTSLTQDRRRLKRRRIIAGLTLREAAARAGCHFTTIGKLERGERSAEPGTLAALAEAYGCHVTDLLPPEPKGVAA